MRSSKRRTSRFPRNCSQNRSVPDLSQVPRGTPPPGAFPLELASSMKDRLEVIYGDTDPRYVLRLARASRTYRDLIRRYSNDSML